MAVMVGVVVLRVLLGLRASCALRWSWRLGVCCLSGDRVCVLNLCPSDELRPHCGSLGYMAGLPFLFMCITFLHLHCS